VGEGSSAEQLTETQLRRLLGVGRTLVSELDVESVLRHVLETARELTEAKYAALGILDPSKQKLERFVHLGIDDETRRRIGPLPEGRGVLGELIRNPRPLRLSDVGEHVRSYGFPPGHPPMRTVLGVPIRIRGEAFGNIYLTEKSENREFDAADETLLVVLADWAAVAIENARSHERSERQRSQQERTVEALEATASLARVGAVETGTDSLLELAVKRGRALLDCRAMLALVPDPAAGLRVSAAAGEGSAEMIGRRVEEEDSSLVSARQEDRVQRVHGGRSTLYDELQVEPTTSLLAHLGQRGQTQGYLIALDPLEREDFSVEDELALGSFASSAATSLSTAHDVERDRLRRTIEAAEQERRRWAMELHDETLQDLGALKVIAEGALSRSDPAEIREAVGKATAQLEHTIAGLESLITELRPASLDELGPAAAIETLVARVEERSGIVAETSVDLAFERGDEPSRHTPRLEATLYRVVQEALNNAAKHSGGKRVSIDVREENGLVAATIEDDGSGFDPSAVGNDRFGLLGMRERIDLLAGELEIDSAADRGTRVSVRLPVERRET
jgi:signal transduction histidine kinase